MPKILLTGATGEFGNAIIKELPEKYRVVGTYSNNVEKAKKMMEENEKIVSMYQIDFLDDSSFYRVIKKIIQENTDIEIIINNAGIKKDSFAMLMTEKAWSDVMNVNLVRSIYITSFAKLNLEKLTNVVNISSISGRYGRFGQMNYAASKAGLTGATKLLQKSYGSSVIFNVISPGMIESNMVDSVSENIKQEFLANCVEQNVGRLENVARLITYVIDDNNRYTHGSEFIIDGGYLL